MDTSYTVVKPLKSVGIGILLTLVLGPIGLFYASVGGALILLVVMPMAILISDALPYIWIYLILVWPVSIIWCAISVQNYNFRIRREAALAQYSLDKKIDSLNKNVHSAFHKIDFVNNQSIELKKSHLQKWLSDNPGKSINDYFAKNKS